MACVACNCQEVEEEAHAFLTDESHLACRTSSDCVTVHVGCAQIEDALCGQVVMNGAAARSDDWDHLREEINACSLYTCSGCTVPREAQCEEGLCR